MDNAIKSKIEKIYALVNHGIEGEKEAAKKALDRLMKKYNIDEEYVKTIHIKLYYFTYSHELDKSLFQRLIEHLLKKDLQLYISTLGQRAVGAKLEYMDWVTLECAYDYFKKHMKTEYKRLVTPQLNRCRTAKSKRSKKVILDSIFFSNYVIASKLYEDHELTSLNHSKMTQEQRKQRASLTGVQGGTYNQQVSTGLYLEQ